MSAVKKILFLFAISSFHLALGQRPTISSIDKVSGAFGDVVTLKGSDFGTNASTLKVFFGSTSATIKTVAPQLLEVTVPAGTSYDNISVINTTNGLIGYSKSQFLMSFSGANGIAATNFGTEYSQKVGGEITNGLYDICSCDFNGDGKTDVASASNNSGAIAIFPNGSTIGTFNFTQLKILLNANTFHITCGDLNGDGKPDIVASEGGDGNRVFYFKNNGNFTFSSQAVTLGGKKVKRVAIADLDLDGKPEVIITNTASNTITILPNQSTLATISFKPSLDIVIPGILSTDALEVRDLNSDGNPELIISQFNTNNSNIFICANKSTPGSFSLSDITTLTVDKSVVNLRVGDLDGDQKPEIAVTRLLGSDVVIFRNTSTLSQISFAAFKSFGTNIRPWGLDFGDLDGDGKPDMVVGSIDVTTKSLSILNNQSTPGNLNFSNYITLPTLYINRQVRIVDVDGDAKPDIAFTSIDDNANGILSSKVSIFRNTSCVIPQVSPSGPLNVCTGYPLQLIATSNPGVTYTWANGATSVAGSTATLPITASGNYAVTVTAEGGVCVKTSAGVAVTVSLGTPLTATPAITSNSPVCTGSTLQLNLNDVGGTDYKWTGPNSVTFSGRNPTVNDFTIDNAGKYSVDIITGTCIARTELVFVDAITIPSFATNSSGSSVVCKGTSKILSITPVFTSGYTYQWYEKTVGALPGQTTSNLSITTSGEYYAQVAATSGGCVPKETVPHSMVTVLAIPTPAFSTSPATVCSGTAVSFTNQSSVDANATAPNIPTYSWTFGDGGTSNLPAPSYTYTISQATAQTFSVFLTADYSGITGCAKSITKSVVVQPAVKPVITSATSGICSGETKSLTIAGTFTSIAWSNGTSGSTTSISQPGTISATTVDANGCTSTAQLVVALKPKPNVAVTADKTLVPLGQSIQLTATGADAYSWTPIETLDNPLLATPKATPKETTVYTVVGKVIDGCSTEQSISIEVNTAPESLKVTNVFTPNGDGKNDVWIIPGIEFYSDCTLSLFDRNGSKILEQKGYKNDWDGTYNGKPVPEGTYYYLISCSDKKPESGNVLVAR